MKENAENENSSTIGSRLMFHFRHIKNIFKNGEPEQKKAREIRLQNMKEWLNEKSKPLTEDIRQKTDSILMKVDEELQKTRYNIEVLENAKLQNPNIPFKAKQYMEGNRKAYIRAVTSFLGHMEINNKDYFYLIDFCKKFEELIDELNKGTVRSYTILQEFFANESGKIAHNLKNFDAMFSELKSVLNDPRIVSVNGLRKKIQELDAKSKHRINAGVELRDSEASLKISNNEKESTMADIIKFDQSNKHNEFINLKEEMKNKEKSFYEEKDSILQSFAVLDRALRKYSHVAFEHEEEVLKYLNNPVESLANDKGMGIITILGTLKKMLDENKIKVDEKKKEKSIDEINKLSKEFIENFVKKYNSFRSEIKEISNKMSTTGVSQKLRDYNSKLEEINLRIERNSTEFSRLKDDTAKMEKSIENIKNEIESSMKDVFGEEIKINIHT
jgi:hypothetical protein